jgi:dsDNA-specific endonuclease/ATPase MutS2
MQPVNNYQLASDALQKELARMKGLAEARDFLSSVGSLEQAASEISGRIDTLKKDEEKLRSSVSAETAKTAAETRDAMIAKATKSAAEIIAKAEMDAAAIVAEAEARKAALAQRAQRLSEAVRAVQ